MTTATEEAQQLTARMVDIRVRLDSAKRKLKQRAATIEAVAFTIRGAEPERLCFANYADATKALDLDQLKEDVGNYLLAKEQYDLAIKGVGFL
jgi:hypothetical protein